MFCLPVPNVHKYDIGYVKCCLPVGGWNVKHKSGLCKKFLSLNMTIHQTATSSCISHLIQTRCCKHYFFQWHHSSNSIRTQLLAIILSFLEPLTSLIPILKIRLLSVWISIILRFLRNVFTPLLYSTVRIHFYMLFYIWNLTKELI